MSRFRHGWVPFPNGLIDDVMPALADTEWRLLTVVVRETLGWQSVDKRRKSVAWLSHKILRKKTGRKSSAISAAIASLNRKQLIVTYDRTGRVLATPAMRRGVHDVMLIGLSPAVHSFSTVWPVLPTKEKLLVGNNKRNIEKRQQQQGINLDIA